MLFIFFGLCSEMERAGARFRLLRQFTGIRRLSESWPGTISYKGTD